VALDTLRFVEILEQAGIAPEHARAHANAAKALSEDNLATRDDLGLVRDEVRSSRAETLRVQSDLDDIKRDLKDLRKDQELMAWRVGVTVGGILGLLAVTLRFFGN
jgi:hypothetical protein